MKEIRKNRLSMYNMIPFIWPYKTRWKIDQWFPGIRDREKALMAKGQEGTAPGEGTVLYLHVAVAIQSCVFPNS
jgi:hypothetical protein